MAADDPRLAYVKLLVYDFSMGVPGAADARLWAGHFGLDRSRNRIVLAVDKAVQEGLPRAVVPGFQLIGPDFTLADESGPADGTGLYTRLLPLLGRLVQGVPR